MAQYRRKPREVEAIQLTERTTLADGTVGQPGDWLVKKPSGRQRIMADDVFQHKYEAVRCHCGPYWTYTLGEVTTTGMTNGGQMQGGTVNRYLPPANCKL